MVIVEKKEIKVGGFMGILAKNKIKVTYGVEDVQISLSAPKNKQENKDILELLQKMGYDGKKDGSNKKEFNLMENENEGVKIIHIGNKPEDTDGCILVGKNTVKGMITSSTETFMSFYKILEEKLEKMILNILLEE